MVSPDRIQRILQDYDKDNLIIATACSHTSLQIFDGARKEGFKTMGIAVGQKTKFYDAFPMANLTSSSMWTHTLSSWTGSMSSSRRM